MGDFNAHTKANGDKTEDTAGRRFTKHTEKLGLQVVNHMAECKGQYSRSMQFVNGTDKSTTIDHICASKELMGRVETMKLGQMLGSDHRFMTLTLSGMEPEKANRTGLREVWRTEYLPVTEDETASFVGTFQKTIDDWIGQTKPHLCAMEAVGIEARRIARHC